MDLSKWIAMYLASASDSQIIITFIVLLTSAGILISTVSNRLFFGNMDQSSDGFFEGVEKSIFAFLFFLLAITLGDVRANFSKGVETVMSESIHVQQYIHLLDLQTDTLSESQRRVLKSYLEAVVSDEWRSLSGASPQLSSEADRAIFGLYLSIQLKVQESGMTTYYDKLLTMLNKLESSRLLRHRLATTSTPKIYWTCIFILSLLACFFAGRTKLNQKRVVVLGAYYGALGMVIGLILILDQPFRGETSVSSEPLRKLLEQMDVPKQTAPITHVQ